MGMGYSGLIYAVIVAAWAGVLIPRWLRRHEEIDQARETDAARGVRVLQRRSAGTRATHHLSLTPNDVPADPTATVGNPDAAIATPGNPDVTQNATRNVPAVAELDEMFAIGAARRRRVLVTLLGTCTLSIYAAIDALLPAWTPAVALGALTGFLLMARRAVITQSRRRRAAVHWAAQITHQAEAVEPNDSPDEDDVRVAVLDEPAVETVDPDAWDPVDVPRPTYMSKPAAPRIVRKIDLTQAGSWTSGRLDPASSIQPPRSAPSASRNDDGDRYDEMPEHKRAVGD